MTATFSFPNHKVSTKYPESSLRVQFGRNWVFTAAPDAPDQRIFSLKFKGYKYYGSAGVPDLVTNASLNNFDVIEDFYKTHRLYLEFNYPHPVYGTVTCRFNKPLEVPDGIENGNGMLEDFTLEFIEVP